MSVTLGANGITFNDGTYQTYGDFLNSNGNSGYQRLPSGLLLQWGLGSQVSAGNNGTSQYMTFPVAFSTVYVVIPSINLNTSTSGAYCHTPYSSGVSTTGFTWFMAAANNGNNTLTAQPAYFAIGLV